MLGKSGACALLIALTALAGCSGEKGHADKKAAEAAPSAPAAIPVDVVTVTASSIENISRHSGRARAFKEAEIRPQVSGIVEELLFEQGQSVEENAPLYKIVDDEYVAAVDRAKAALKSADAAASVARETEKRLKSLVAQSAVSQQEYDNADAAYRQAVANVDVQKAALNTAQISLDRTTIRAPISGVIGRSAVTQGALVTQGQSTPLAQISQLDPIYIDLTVPTVDVLEFQQSVASGELKAAEGKIPFKVVFENDAAYAEQGVLDLLEVNVDERAGTVVLRGTIPNPSGQLMPGMFLRAEIAAGTLPNAITTPQRSIVRTPTGDASVFVVTQSGAVEQRIVTLGGSAGNRWIVRSGLAAGDKVAVSGLQRLRNGMVVEPVEMKPETSGQ